MFSKFFIFLLVIFSLGVFFHNANINYEQHVKIKQSFVEHPEFIPTNSVVRLVSG